MTYVRHKIARESKGDEYRRPIQSATANI